MAFTQFPVEANDEHYPVRIIRSNNGGKFKDGDSGALCRDRGIKQEFTTLHTPQLNGVVERAIGVAESVARAVCIQAPTLFSCVDLPDNKRLSANSLKWAVDSLNRTSITADPDNKSPYETYH